ncbi:hypothetical protein CRYUN_Cryun13aG0041200 [Craigia yunnanensis]
MTQNSTIYYSGNSLSSILQPEIPPKFKIFNIIIKVAMEEGQQLNKWEGYVNWRNRPAMRGHHGGMLAASFVLVVEILENLAFLANASNLVLYLSKFMHYSPSNSANIVTNFMGTAFLLALLVGFLADAFFTTYHLYLTSAAIELMGLLILTVQAHIPSLKPPTCVLASTEIPCQKVNGHKADMLFTGLHLVALGVGGIKGSLPPHGAKQFDETTPQGRKQRSLFFNYYVFCLSCGTLIAVTFVVWIEDNKGWQWGFGIATATILTSIPVFLLGSPICRTKIPAGSPITTMFKLQQFTTTVNLRIQAMQSWAWRQAHHPTVLKPVKEKKLSTFSVQQAATMNTKIGSLKVPPASLPVFPVIFMMILAPTYNHVIIPFARKVTKTEMGITHLQRIGIGLVLSIIAMAVAALVEIKRKKVAVESGLLNSADSLPITFLWIALQYLFLGSADLFTLAGMMEFFFTEAPTSMRSLATSLSWASLAMGYYFSSVLI